MMEQYIALPQNRQTMLRLLSILVLCSLSAISLSQTSGTIHYTSVRKIQMHIEGDMPPPPGLPDKITQETLLLFTPAASLYKNAAQSEDEMNVDQDADGGQMLIMKMAPPENIIYCDLENSMVTQQREFMQRRFLIEAPMQADGFKLTGKQKFILNYPCQEAVMTDSLDTVSVWFTPIIPLSIGPLNYYGMPGAVLEVNINHGLEMITATAITPEVDKDAMVKPKDGKEVTQEEYDAIVAEKLKEMGIENGGPGGKVVIRIEND